MKKVTPLNIRVGILADLWSIYRDVPAWEDFINSQDLGLPLAHMVDNSIIYMNRIVDTPAEDLIDETFESLLTGLGIKKDSGFESLDDIISPE